MAKRILILAGTHFQIPVIEYAKKQGHYVITCDNKPENPGHKIADEYFNVSTTDFKGVLDIAKKENIDGILAYGSDPAAPTAAYVSQKLNLPGNSFSSVLTLSDKGLFRRFLTKNNFPAPVFGVFKSLYEARVFYDSLGKNVFVKPVDSSGSKGINKLESGKELKTEFSYALEFSRKGEVIIEEEIESKGPHIHGEAFVNNGEVIFMLLGDQYFSPVSVCAPISTTVPTMFHSDIMEDIRSRLVEIIRLVGFNTGGLNIEIIRDKKDNIYFMEIGARNGGNFMPELITLATEFKMAAANVNAVLNEPIDLDFRIPNDAYYTQLILHSADNGIFIGNNLNGQFDENIKFKKEYFVKGDFVKVYKDSRSVMGVFLYKFSGKDICTDFINYINKNTLTNIEVSLNG